MYHALLISQLATFSRNFSIIKKKNNVNFSVKDYRNLKFFRKIFINKVTEYGFDPKKVELLSYLTFLNICPLHDEDIGNLLFLAGKYYVTKFLENESKYKLN